MTLDFLFFVVEAATMRWKQEAAGVQTGSSISHTSRVYNQTCRVFFNGPFISAAAFLFGDVVFCYPPKV